MSKSYAKLTFEGLVSPSAYYANAANYDGYLGFDFSDIELVTRAGLERHGDENKGYLNDLHGEAEITLAGQYYGFVYYGFIKSPSHETFNLTSGWFAAGSSYYPKISVVFAGYDGKTLKGKVTVTLTETPTKIDFASFGKTFDHITELYVGGYHAVVAIDNLITNWNGPIPGIANKRHLHIAQALGIGGDNHSGMPWSGHDVIPGGDEPSSPVPYHPAVSSAYALTGHPEGGGLTAEFSLGWPILSVHG